MITPEQRVVIGEIIDEALAGAKYKIETAILDHITANTTEDDMRKHKWSEGETNQALTTEDESLWLSEAGFCGTCAFFHREPRCPGGICGRFESKPQVEIVFGCEEYETDKDYENYWLNKED